MSSEVKVVVGAETSALSAGLAAATHAVDEFKEKASESFKEFGSEMLGGLGVAAAVEGIHSLVEEFSKVEDQAERLGTTAEAIQRIGAVAKSVGSDVETFAKSLQKGSRNAVEALQGSEELASAFEKLGIEAKEFANASPEEQLVQLAEGYEKAGQSAETNLALFKAFGRSATDLIPALRKGGETLREEMESAAVASNATVASLKESGEHIEAFWRSLKAHGADALNAVIHKTQELGQAAAVAYAYISNLSHGFAAAKKAAEEAAEAAAEINQEEEKKRDDKGKKRTPVDPEALDGAKKKADQEKEAARLKEENDKKAHEMELRSYDLQKRKVELQKDYKKALEEQQGAQTNVDQEKGRSKRLDVQRELAATQKEIDEETARSAERTVKQVMAEEHKHNELEAREKLSAQKKALSEAEKDLGKLKSLQEKHVSVDDLRRIGGGAAGVNYKAGASRDDMIRQQVQHAQKSVELLQKLVEATEKQNQSNVMSFDPSMPG